MIERVLVIKLSSLGDFIYALGPMAAIRRHHAGARITLLTTKPYAALGASSPYFDEVWLDERPAFSNLGGIWRLRRRLIGGRFDRIYDLQTSDRSDFYFHLMGPGRRPEWSGTARGCSHPHANPRRDFIHTIDRQREQLAMAGVGEVGPPDLSWVKEPLDRFALPERFIALVPGATPHRAMKRWPPAAYGELARRVAQAGLAPVIIGGISETAIADEIRAAEPAAIDLTTQTSYGEVATLGTRATHVVGNDTGPVHLMAAAGAPTTILYSNAGDPALSAPVGSHVTALRRPVIADLSVAEVAATLPLG